MVTKRYRILNPRNVSRDIYVLTFAGKGPGGGELQAYEGDIVELTLGEVDLWLDRKFLEEVAQDA